MIKHNHDLSIDQRIVDADDLGLEKDSFSRLVSYHPNAKGRNFRLKEVEQMALAITGEKLAVKAARARVEQAADAQETLMNISVRYRRYKGKLFPNYTYRGIGAAAANTPDTDKT